MDWKCSKNRSYAKTICRTSSQAESFAMLHFSHREKENLIVLTMRVRQNNIPLEKNGKQTEIDTLVVSKYGIFLGEVKNYKGQISGNENDLTWAQIKESSGGKCYENTIKNPVKQAKFQTYLLSSILKENGLNCYIHPYVVFTGAEDIITDSELVLRSENEFHNTILSYHDTRISNENLKKLKGVIECLKK